MESKGKLKLFDLVSIGVGSVIGAGIFSMLMSGMAMTGRSIALALVGAMLITILQQIRSIFMSSMWALDGGQYAQQALILPPVFTGITAVIFVFSNFSFSVFGISIAQYLAQLIPALAPYTRVLGVIILTAFFLITVRGTGFLAKIQNVMAVCMYAALALFIVLFASSSLDKGKAAQMEYAMAAAFNAIPSEQMNGTVLSFLDDAKDLDLGEGVGLGSDSKGAVLDIADVNLFEQGEARITPEGVRMLKRIAPLLGSTRYKRFRIVVEGHTDDIPVSTPLYPSGWELSAARAAAVVKEFIKAGLVPDRFQAVGMADIAPKYPNRDLNGTPIPENRVKNRRIAIHIEM